MSYRDRQLNNKGFSLVELIVTVLIIAIISTSSVIAISVVYNSDVDRAAKIMTASMNQGRQQALSIADSEHSAAQTKTDVYTEIYLNDNGYYCVDVYSQNKTTVVDSFTGGVTVAYGDPQILDSKQLGKYKMTIEFGEYNSSTGVVTPFAPNFAANDKVVFTYDRSSGGIEKSYVKASDGTITEYSFTDAYIKGSKTVNLVFVRETGRCYIGD